MVRKEKIKNIEREILIEYKKRKGINPSHQFVLDRLANIGLINYSFKMNCNYSDPESIKNAKVERTAKTTSLGCRSIPWFEEYISIN
jgi:hypothetical protein